MISFSQLLILLFIILLLFGDVKKVINKIFLMVFNLRDVVKKISADSKKTKKS